MVLWLVNHHVPDGGGFRDKLVLCSSVEVGKSFHFNIALELDRRDGDVKKLVVDCNFGG